MGTPKQWSKWVPWVEYNYNTLFHTSTHATPFEILYGRPPPLILGYKRGLSVVDEVDKQLCDRDDMLAKLKMSLQRAQHRMLKAANEKRRDVGFAIDDWVYLKLRSYHQSSLAWHGHPNLAPRYILPFKIVARVGKVAYRLA